MPTLLSSTMVPEVIITEVVIKEVAILTTFGVTIDDNVGIMMTLEF